MHVGDFLKDEVLPQGFDIILLSRVLETWSEEVCIKILKMAYAALNEGGYVVICESFRDFNENLVLLWEFRYVFWDAFNIAVFKESAQYIRMLEDIGFINAECSPMNNENCYQQKRH